MKLIPWQPGFTWRKLGYLTGSNSLNYRQVLEDNPDWDVITEPPIGAVIRLKTPNSLGQLQSVPPWPVTTGLQVAREVYPFPSYEEYVNSLSKYSTGALMNSDRVNGWSMDSNVAFTGVQ